MGQYKMMLPLLEAFEMDAWNDHLHFLEYYSQATEKPTMALLGEFSAGKTSLIEALLETKAGVVDILESTKCPVYFVYGDEARIYPFSKQVPTIQSFDIASISLLTASAKEADWLLVTLPNENLKKVSLLDTPGSNASTTFDLGFIPCITYAWCMPYGDVLSETQMTTLNELGATHLIATKADLIDEDEEEEVEELFSEIQDTGLFKWVTQQSSLWLNHEPSLRKSLWEQLFTQSRVPARNIQVPIIDQVSEELSSAISRTANMKYTSIERKTRDVCRDYDSWESTYRSSLINLDTKIDELQQEWYILFFNMIWKNGESSNSTLVEKTVNSFKQTWKEYNNFSLKKVSRESIVNQKEQMISLLYAMEKRLFSNLSWPKTEQNEFHDMIERAQKLDQRLNLILEKDKGKMKDQQLQEGYERFSEFGTQHLKNIKKTVKKNIKKNYLNDFGEIVYERLYGSNGYIEISSGLKDQIERDNKLILIREMEVALTSIKRGNLYLVEEILKNSPRKIWGLPKEKQVLENPWKAITDSLYKLEEKRDRILNHSADWQTKMDQAEHSLDELNQKIDAIGKKLSDYPIPQDNEWNFINTVAERVISDSRTLLKQVSDTHAFTYQPVYMQHENSEKHATKHNNLNHLQWNYSLFKFDTLSMMVLFSLLLLIGPFISWSTVGMSYGSGFLMSLLNDSKFLWIIAFSLIGSLTWSYLAHRHVEKTLMKSKVVGVRFTTDVQKTAKLDFPWHLILIGIALLFVEIGNYIFGTDRAVASYVVGAILPFMLFRNY
ncbi:dynamin family protein [Exiguobacterium sp. SL-9]|uniref:dynamin family protein n=1 Tax=Exiguobacterium sp. SL-9 TaxID=2510963 RepID=UPI001375EB23|nr:dynamin family protein [Exiguobacterium sp. SL-9]